MSQLITQLFSDQVADVLVVLTDKKNPKYIDIHPKQSQISRHTSTPGFICEIQCGEYRKLKDSGEIGEEDIRLL